MPVSLHVPWKWNIFLHPHLTLNGLGQHFIVPQHYADLSSPGSLLTAAKGKGTREALAVSTATPAMCREMSPSQGYHTPRPSGISSWPGTRINSTAQHARICAHTPDSNTHAITHTPAYTQTHIDIRPHTHKYKYIHRPGLQHILF